MRIEQRGKGAQNTALGLSSQAKQDKVMPRQECIDELRHDCIVIADDSGENRVAGADFGHQIFADFVFYFARDKALLGKIAFS